MVISVSVTVSNDNTPKAPAGSLREYTGTRTSPKALLTTLPTPKISVCFTVFLILSYIVAFTPLFAGTSPKVAVHPYQSVNRYGSRY